MFAATVMVSLGTILSSAWITAANSWLQTPAGAVVRHGQFVPVDWTRVIFRKHREARRRKQGRGYGRLSHLCGGMMPGAARRACRRWTTRVVVAA